jgi:redox-sensitive bicupin YhaK (pirin superfamily)
VSLEELLPGREVVIGTREGTTVTRILPNKERRLVGAWCFADHYGPTDITRSGGMSVAPHPHAGLQTVSWLIQGEIMHHDSLGNEQLIRPGQLNLMTAGFGIAHAEESPAHASPMLHGVQLWVALPSGESNVDAHFEHHADLPSFTANGLTVTVLMGQLSGHTSPAKAYTPIVGAQLRGTGVIEVREDFEHMLLPLDGSVSTYYAPGEARLAVKGDSLLLGGEPFDEQIVMWWNFVGRSHEDIVAMRSGWEDQHRFGEVPGDQERIPAPPMPITRLLPRGRMRH